jgi:ATP-dependent DNA helicase RecG
LLKILRNLLNWKELRELMIRQFIRLFENPGSIRTGKKQMLRGGISDPRNKTLMKMFNMIGIGERAGSGILDIYQVWGNEGWAVPVVEESYNPDRTRLTLEFAKKQAGKPNDKKQTTKTEIHREKIRNFLTENELASARAISMVIGLSAERTRVILAKMEDAESVGGNRNRKYKLRTEKQFDKEPPWTEKTKP